MIFILEVSEVLRFSMHHWASFGKIMNQMEVEVTSFSGLHYQYTTSKIS